MHNRVVDRAAAHATSAELAVRDWLLVALSFSTGIYEAKPYCSGSVFLDFAERSYRDRGADLAGLAPRLRC